ncbi:hypothetical protein [Actinomadura sp. WMMB 499]|uniref:hypothetical protein n=1 Tax=Actinomadura sp. WMMB 499 TaxID=1219491 RepID=UPI001248B0B7|nr:hypothetical protein [Actinomadura sp. WMMB 499]QFG22613.1 hypothetical protein F7P10_17305 [Actinomadura sp. WMMB 499]
MAKSGTAWTAAAAGVLAVAAGCGTVEGMATGEAAPDGRKIAVGTAAGGLAPAARWPDACTLLTEDELRAVLPELEKVDIRPDPVRPEWWDGAAAGDAGALLAQAARVAQATAKGHCTYSMLFPYETRGKRTSGTPDHGTATVTITLVAVGAPDVAARVYAARKAADREVVPVDAAGADACHRPDHLAGTDDLTCVKGPLVFTVAGGKVAHIRIGDTSSYENEFRGVFRDRVIVPVVETVAADV